MESHQKNESEMQLLQKKMLETILAMQKRSDQSEYAALNFT
jgi:hypothetical protein